MATYNQKGSTIKLLNPQKKAVIIIWVVRVRIQILDNIQTNNPQLGGNVTPRLVLQGCYNQPGNEMLFKSKMFSITFKTLKAFPSIDCH